jgi:hypothetical protein
MKNAYQRRRVKARVEKSARMRKLDAITLDFARQVIEEETGAPLDIRSPSASVRVDGAQGSREATGAPGKTNGAPDPREADGAPGAPGKTNGAPDLQVRGTGERPSTRPASAEPPMSEAKLIARDERKNPLISTFDWTADAAQRILRVPAGFMRSKTQERIEELARERAVATIDLALVEEGIEIGKKMMAEMIAGYSAPGAAPAVAKAAQGSSGASEPDRASGYLNEVRTR